MSQWFALYFEVGPVTQHVICQKENALVFLFHLFGTSPLGPFYRFITTTAITNELTILLMKISALSTLSGESTLLHDVLLLLKMPGSCMSK